MARCAKKLRQYIGLYSTEAKLQLPLKSITEECKTTKARQVMMLRDCRDKKVKEAGAQVVTGRKWSAAKTQRPDSDTVT